MFSRLTALVGISAVLVGCAAPSSISPQNATPIYPTVSVGDGQTLPAGTYYVDAPFPVRLTFEVPDGFVAWAHTSAGTQLNLSGGEGEISFEIIENVVADACSTEQLDPPVGPTADDLATALSNLDGFDASAATDITVDGFEGKQFTLTSPNPAPCESMYTWSTTTRQNGVGPGEVAEVRILDVDGVRQLIAIATHPPLAGDDRATLDAIVESVQLD